MPATPPSDLTNDPSGGAFYLYGDDAFRKAQAAKRIAERHLDPGTRDFNYDRLSGRDADVETIASLIATPPMMASWRVITIREIEALASSAKARKVLLEAVAKPPPGLALILIATVPERSSARFYKDLAKKARSAEFKRLGQDDLPGWIMARSSDSYGAEFAPDAARALALAVGADLGVLDREIAKLVEVSGGDPVTTAHVESAGTNLPRQDRWRWFDMVGSRRFDEAERALPVLLEQGETGVGLVIGLTSHLLRLGVLVAGGRGALERVLPPHQRWLAKPLSRQARQWSGEDLETALRGLRDVDRLLKASPLPDRHHLSAWLLARRAAPQGRLASA